MNQRRGFDHWLGSNQNLMPQPLAPDRLLRYYWFLRHSVVPLSRRVAANRIIMSHIRLGMSIVSYYAVRWPNKVDLLVAEMLYCLVNSTDLIAKGAIDCHDEPNVTGYLVTAIKGHLNKVGCRDRVMSIDPSRYKRGISHVAISMSAILDLEKTNYVRKGKTMLDELVVKQDSTSDLLEMVLSCTEYDTERDVVFLRIAGFKDEEIGNKLGLSKMRISQIRSVIRDRVMEKLNESDS